MNRFLLCAFMLCAVITGQCQPETGGVTQSFIAVDVNNMDASIAWYKTMLNMTLENRIDNAERSFKQSNLKNNYFHLELVELKHSMTRAMAEEQVKKSIQGIVKYGFKVNDFSQWHERFVSFHANFIGRITSDDKGKRMMMIEDPDGNRIQIIEN